ncbi:MAG TPA: iron-sulfur cluster assembly scaffold protein [Candidatus Saccharimonadales bacterium]|nr:iron-sulfur cluster assembly scaffold protein [Candidatus Saccharimonadales bacterium]
MTSNDDNFYREELMEIYKNPANKGSLANPTVHVHETNPMCGDVIDLDLDIKDNQVVNAKFNGDTCAVSAVSAELLLEEIKGKSLAEINQIDKEKLLNLIGITLTTSRIKCATLSLEALQKALKTYEETTKNRN